MPLHVLCVLKNIYLNIDWFVCATPVEALCEMVGASLANMERGSVPSSMELRGSAGAEEDEEEDEEVLPLRAPRRVFVSVTWVERRGGDLS